MMKNKSLPVLLTLCGLLASAPSIPTYAASSSAVNQLFDQAEYWQSKNRPDLAEDALQRIISADPNNAKALYRLAILALQENKTAQADKWIKQLRSVSPDDPRLEDIKLARLAQKIDPIKLADARKSAAGGHYRQSVSQYQELFGGKIPPQELAPEYYLTLAGTDNSGWQEAHDQLKKLHEKQPKDVQLARAYGQVQTYREGSRRDGIKLLRDLAASDAQSEQGWRQALLWLDARRSDKSLYDTYLAKHPDDAAVEKHYQQKIADTPTNTANRLREAGYRALKRNQLSNAENDFNAALKHKSKDPDALAGLGIVYLRDQQFDKAKRYLQQAISLSKEKQPRWSRAYRTAEFYEKLATIRRQVDNNQLQNALLAVTPLTKRAGDQGIDATLLQADILRQQGRLPLALQQYREVNKRQPDNIDAKIGQISVLQLMQRWDDAQQLTDTLPASASEKLSQLKFSQAQALRVKAKSESPTAAEFTLRRAIKIAPNSPWARLDLARLLDKQGNTLQAQAVMQPLTEASHAPNDYYAAALFASEQGRWKDALDLLNMVPANQQTAPMQELAERAQSQHQLKAIKDRLAQGDRDGVKRLLAPLFNNPPETPSALSDIADVMVEAGEPAMAVALLRNDIDKGLQAAPGDYSNYVVVLAKAGHYEQAEELLHRLQQQRNIKADDLEQLSKARTGLTIVHVQQLEQQKELADAYDILAAELNTKPNNVELLLAMARLYQTGDKNTEANQLYRYISELYPDDERATEGVIYTSLTLGDTDEAKQVVERQLNKNPNDAKTLLLAAKVAQARHDNEAAMAYLQRAQQLNSDAKFRMKNGQTLLTSNPFREDSNKQADNPFRTASFKKGPKRPSWLPGSSGTEPVITSSQNQPALGTQIDTMMQGLRNEDATYIEAHTTIRRKDGEEGLSQLFSAETPITISGKPVGNGRVSFTMTPTHISAGHISQNSQSRFGRNAVIDVPNGIRDYMDIIPEQLAELQTLAENWQNAQTLYQAGLNDEDLSAPELARLQIAEQNAEQAFDNATQNSLLASLNIPLENLSPQQQQLINQFFAENFSQDQLSGFINAFRVNADSPAEFTDESARITQLVQRINQRLANLQQSVSRPKTQDDDGIGLKLAYKWRTLDADIGTTPLGFNDVNIIGGISWQPKLGTHSQGTVTVERRPVTDSYLSYAGAKDNIDGEEWGAVTRTGAKLGLSYDEPEFGMYGAVSGYKYDGNHVQSNRSYHVEAGAYLRPLWNEDQQLQTGVHVGYSSYDHNQNHFTYGHGGYFSPQSYLSIAFPITYTRFYDRWNYSAHIAPGFQSYSEDAEPYFPTDSEGQAILDILSELDLIAQSRYEQNTEDGFGINVGGQAQYKLSDKLTVGGKLNFDSFGDYNEGTFGLYMDYLLNNHN